MTRQTQPWILCAIFLALLVGCGTKRPRPEGVSEKISHSDRKAAWETTLKLIKDRGLSVYEWDEASGVIETGKESSFADGTSERKYWLTFLVTDDRVDVDLEVEFCSPLSGCDMIDNRNAEERKLENAVIATLRRELSRTTTADASE